MNSLHQEKRNYPYSFKDKERKVRLLNKLKVLPTDYEVYVESEGLTDKYGKTGKWKFTSYDGELLFLGSYFKGHEDGYWEHWETSSEGIVFIESKGNYSFGHRYGEWKFFFSNGKLKSHRYYFMKSGYPISCYVDIITNRIVILIKDRIWGHWKSLRKSRDQWDKYFNSSPRYFKLLDAKDLQVAREVYSMARLYSLNL